VLEYADIFMWFCFQIRGIFLKMGENNQEYFTDISIYNNILDYKL